MYFWKKGIEVRHILANFSLLGKFSCFFIFLLSDEGKINTRLVKYVKYNVFTHTRNAVDLSMHVSNKEHTNT